MAALQALYPGDYHVTVVSTETFTTFTPLLPCMLSSSSVYTQNI
jgi:NADH dehydrogenase